jgi:hypothetical protein
MQALRAAAMQYPEVEEGVACKGTAIECSTFKARNKAFLFVGAKEIRLKLSQSLPEANKLADKEPGRYNVGSSGWVKVTLDRVKTPPLDTLKRWIEESYRLLAPKQLVALLPAKGSPASIAKSTANRKSKKPAASK